jgi:hypothetical protein
VRAVAASRGGFDPKTKTFRKDGCDGAVEQLEHAIPQIADPLLASTGANALIQCLRDAGRDADANRTASNFLRLHPGARGVPAVQRMTGSARKE